MSSMAAAEGSTWEGSAPQIQATSMHNEGRTRLPPASMEYLMASSSPSSRASAVNLRPARYSSKARLCASHLIWLCVTLASPAMSYLTLCPQFRAPQDPPCTPASASSSGPGGCRLHRSGTGSRRPACGPSYGSRASPVPWLHTLVRYSLDRVSTLTRSPTLMKSGTCTTTPVSRVAGLVPPVAVSPLSPGSVSETSRSTCAGGSTLTTSPSAESTLTVPPSTM